MNRRDLACWNCGELAVNEPCPYLVTPPVSIVLKQTVWMCRHFDPSRRTCQHDLADPPRESDSNFCDYLSPHFGRKGRADVGAVTRRHRWLNCW